MISLYLLGVIFSFALAVNPISVNVDNSHITEGESINLTLTLTDIKGDPNIDFTDMVDFKVISGPIKSNSTNVQFINGKTNRSSTIKLSWNLMPKKIGKLIIPDLKVQLGDKLYSTNKIVISVSKRGSLNKDKQPKFFIEAKVDKQTLFRGEQLTLTYTLYTKVDVTSFDEEMPSFKGFWIEELFSPKKLQLRKEVKNGVQYHSAVVKKIALFPTQSGYAIIEPFYAVIGIRENQQRWNDFSLFGPPSKKYTISTNEISIDVIPLPANPNGLLSSLVGQWDIRSNINSSIIKQDEAIIFQIVISGTGNLPTVPQPEINFPNELEIFDPEVKTKKNPLRDKVGGEKLFEWVLIPRYSGEILVPEIRLQYFDPNKKKWIIKSTPVYNLKVAPNEKAAFTSTGLSKEEVVLLGKDIHFIDNSIPKWQNKKRNLINSTKIALLLISGLILSFPFILNSRMERVEKTLGNRRAKKALNSSINILRSEYTSPEMNYTQIYQAIVCFINHKMDLIRVEYSTSEILDIINNHIDEQNYRALETILLRLESIRFAGLISSSSENDLNEIETLLRNIDHDWK